MTLEEIKQYVHYQPAKSTTVCGFMKTVVDSGYPQGVLAVQKTTDIIKVTCPKCRKEIKRVVLTWGME